jgi:phage shock protein A
MRFLRRVGDVIGANLNDLVDRLDDPEVMLRQAVREMDDAIAGATAAAARAIAGERRLAEELARRERQAGRWQARAEQAVAGAADDLARRALARRLEHESTGAALREQWAAAREASGSLRRQVEAMKARRAGAARQLSTLSARRRAAEACKTLRGLDAGPDSLFGTRGFARFARMREAVELAEAEARALIELHVDPGDELEAALEAREDERRIEDELAAIKESLRSRP